MNKKELAIEIKKDCMLKHIKRILIEANFDNIHQNKLEEFVDINFGTIKKSNQNAIVLSYINFLNEQKISKKILKEADTFEDSDIEHLDKVSLFQDLSDVQANLSDSFAKLYTYKSQYIDNPNWKASLSQMRIGISELISRMAATMAMIGLENDSKAD